MRLEKTLLFSKQAVTTVPTRRTPVLGMCSLKTCWISHGVLLMIPPYLNIYRVADPAYHGYVKGTGILDLPELLN